MDPGWPISCTEAPELATPALHGETTESDADSRDHTAAVLCSVLLIRGGTWLSGPGGMLVVGVETLGGEEGPGFSAIVYGAPIFLCN